MAVLPASQAYQDALIALNTIVQAAYNDIGPDMLLDMSFSDPNKYLFIKVNNTVPKVDNSTMYDFNILGKTLEVSQSTGYGDTPKVCISYTSSKNNAEILTKNTPEVTDDPVECYSRTNSEFATRTSWRSNFYI